MLTRTKDFLVNDKELDSGWQKFLSLIFLAVAGSMSFMSYTREVFWVWHPQLQFTPTFLSSLIGIVLISPLYLRSIFKWNRSIYTIISFVLILLVFASFVELAMGGNKKSTIVYSLIGISIALSWVGIRGVAGISWILVLAAAVYSMITNNLALGFYGYIYICFGFMGLILHTGLNPGAFMKDIKGEYSKATMYAKNTVKAEIQEAGTFLQESSIHLGPALSKSAAASPLTQKTEMSQEE